MLEKTTGINYEYFYWQGQSPSHPWVRICSLEWGGGSGWEAICKSRPMLCQRIYKGWELYPPRLRWKAAQWRDWNDWRRVLGDRRGGYQPNITVEIGYGVNLQGQFFFEAFRFAPIGLPPKVCAQSLGNFMALIFDKLPVPETDDGDVIIIRDPHSEENQIFWLGVILQGSRMILG